GAPGGERFVLNDVLAGTGGPDAQLTVPLRLRADDGDLYVQVAQRRLDIAEVGDAEIVGKLPVALVRPLRDAGIISHDDNLKPRMRRHAAGDIVMLHGTENGTAVAGNGHAIRPPG